MQLLSPCLIFGLMAFGAHASPLNKREYKIDVTNCQDGALDQILDGITKLLRILPAVTTDANFNSADQFYTRFFGASPQAFGPASFADIKLRFQNVRRILLDPTDKITFTCPPPPPPNTLDSCRPGVAAYVDPTINGAVVNFCPPYFNGYPSIFTAAGAVDCAGHSGVNARIKTKEQVLLHEFMHLSTITTAAAVGAGDRKNQIIDCFYGTYPTSNARDYTNGYQVSRINADSYSFLAMYRYLNQQCAIAPTYSPNIDIYPPIKNEVDPRCYLGDLNPGAPGIDILNGMTARMATTYNIPRPLVHGTFVDVPVAYFCPPQFVEVASQNPAMKRCNYP